jgi:hypothetical protein
MCFEIRANYKKEEYRSSSLTQFVYNFWDKFLSPVSLWLDNNYIQIKSKNFLDLNQTLEEIFFLGFFARPFCGWELAPLTSCLL